MSNPNLLVVGNQLLVIVEGNSFVLDEFLLVELDRSYLDELRIT